MSKTVWIIHQYASTPKYGMGGRHFYLSEELAKLGYKVYLIAASANHLLHTQPNLTADIKIEPVNGFNFVWVRLPGYRQAHSKQRAINWFLFPWKVQRLAKLLEHKPDAILCSSPSPIAFLGAQRLARKFNARLIFEVRDIWPLTLTEVGGYSTNHPFIRFMQWVEKRAYRDADCVVSNLRNSVEHMVSHGMPRQKFQWIPNGFSRAEVELRTPLSERASSLIPNDKFIVGYTGTLGVANALDVLIEAASKLTKFSDIAFVLVGQGKEKDKLQKQAESLGLNSIYFIDPIPKMEIQSMLKRFDVCYIGLTPEPLFRFGVSPNKLFDYLYSSKPIIYAIDSGQYRPVEEASAGIQIEPGNSQAIADAVIKLYRLSHSQRQEMGANGRKLAEEMYEYSQLARRLESVIFG